MTIALAGLGRLTADIDPAAVAPWFWYYRADPEVIRWLRIGATLAGLGLVLLIGAALLNQRRPLHGAARWARGDELARAGLRARSGVILGTHGGRLMRFGGSEHVLLYAPTRTGKGVGVVVPNLLTWSGSLLVLDIKGENWTASAGARAKKKHEVFRFDPLEPDGRTHCFNPLGHIDRNDHAKAFDDFQRISVMLFPTRGEADVFWSEAARIGFVGVAAFVSETPRLQLTLGEIYRQLTTGDPRTRFPEEIVRRSQSGHPLSGPCTSALNDFCNANDRTFASIRQTLTSRIGLFLNPLVDAATARSDFDLRAMRQKPMSIYLCASPENIERVAPLYALLLQQALDFATRGPPAAADRPSVLIVLDEFAKLGPMNVLAQAFSFVAGYGVRLLCVLQSPAQLRANYGADVAEEIITNCGVEVVFTPKDIKVAHTLSDRLGTYGHLSKSLSRPAGLQSGRRSVSLSEQARPLMLAQELLTLGSTELLVLRSGIPPIRGRKLRYFDDRRFKGRVCRPPEVRKRAAPDPAAPQASFVTANQAFEDVDDLDDPTGDDQPPAPREHGATIDGPHTRAASSTETRER